ncbi:hypothetical protein INT47_004731 [Mucor saturninus]|uniref:Uncharacterized protein n=1 Tax=Mucor saturninus TaxID=64648 RepID=A0A8H7UUL2_9FUNG|nr:hypothetical protein INT47_004731 [Mucor saturninus]
MSEFNTTQCKRSLETGPETTSTKQRISLSRRKTRQKKECGQSSSQQELRHKEQDKHYKHDSEDLPFESTYPVKKEKPDQITSLNLTASPSIPESSTSLQETSLTIENMDLSNGDFIIDSDIGYTISNTMLSTQEFPESNNYKSSLKDTLKHDCKTEEEAEVKLEYKNETDGDVKVKYEVKEETFSDVEFKHKVKEDQNCDIKVDFEEKYECPICDVDLTFITSTEIRQEHVMGCISSAEYTQETSICSVCNRDITYLTINQRQKHANRCLDGSSVTTYNRSSSNDFATQQPIFINKLQRLPKSTREEDKHDELYQATLAMSKSLQKPDKKAKIELDEANIWSNQESRLEASHQLSILLDAQNEIRMSIQSEREISIGSIGPSTILTMPTLLLSRSPSINFWGLAALEDMEPSIYNCAFLGQSINASKEK